MKKDCRICHTAILPWIFKKKEEQKKEEQKSSLAMVTRWRRRSAEEEREPECEVTAGVSAVNVSQSLKQSNIPDYFK